MLLGSKALEVWFLKYSSVKYLVVSFQNNLELYEVECAGLKQLQILFSIMITAYKHLSTPSCPYTCIMQQSAFLFNITAVNKIQMTDSRSRLKKIILQYVLQSLKHFIIFFF